MRKSRIAYREDLGEDMSRILKEFTEWFLPATMKEVGCEFVMFLKWLEDNDYSIVKNGIDFSRYLKVEAAH